MSQTPEKVHVPKQTVDTELLNELRDLFARAEDQKERYDFTWNGKAKAYFEAATPPTKTLRPQPEESVDFENSGNLFITGDNLEALKLLQESYLGKIDMIYIDPPYNTGKDFVYRDNFGKSVKAADEAEGSIDEEGTRLIKNDKSAGRFHSDWLSMMYPRLKLARNLLSDTGVIFVSIDDHEQANLKLLMDEVFGEDNFVGCAGRITKKANNKGDFWAPNFDYLLTYVKSVSEATPFIGEANVSAYNQIEEEGERKGEKYQLVRLYMSSIQNRNPEQRFWIKCPDGQEVMPPGSTFPPQRPELGDGIWRWTRTKFESEKDKIVIKRVKSSNLVTKDGSPARWNVFTKTYLQDVIDSASSKPNNFIENYINQLGSHELRALDIPFDYSKPSAFIKYLMSVSRIDKNGIVLDFFAGSATTGDAVMQLNSEDGGNRKSILCTLDESVNENSEAKKRGFETIDQISRERMRRAANKISKAVKQDVSKKEWIETADLGFRALKIDDLGIREDVFKTANETGQGELLDLATYQKEGRSDYDLLYDVLIDGALAYHRKIDKDILQNVEIIKYDYLGELTGVIAYFGDELTDELTRSIAALKPLIAVFKESTFNKSSEKVNVLEQFRVISPDTKVKVV